MEVVDLAEKYHFNPRSPYGERLNNNVAPPGNGGISIHAPLTGSDLRPAGMSGSLSISIHAPLTGSDVSVGVLGHGDAISIHAPLTGSDSKNAQK